MMQTTIEAALANAAIATALAGIVWCVTRFCRNPALQHMLWLVVLLKLVSPPMVSLPLDFRFSNARDAGIAANLSGPGMDELRAGENQRAVMEPFHGRRAQSGARPSERSTAASSRADDRYNQRPSIVSSPSPSERIVQQDRTAAIWRPLLLAVWTVGSVVFVVIAACRIIRFHMLLSTAKMAPPWLRAMTADMAARLDVRNCPDVGIVDAQIPPLVWPLGRRAKIVLPQMLVDGLADGELRALVAHELAHLGRWDHLVRWLELVVLAVYWWHPIAWWARHRLQTAEEAACDDRVVSVLRNAGHQYATALVRTIDLLAESVRMAPAVSSGLFRRTVLKHRIERILHMPPQQVLSWPKRLLVLSAACVLLPLSIQAVSQDETSPRERTATHTSDQSDSPATQLERRDQYGDPLPERAVARLGTVRLRHPSNVHAVAISPDSKLVASSSRDGEIRLWEAETGELLHALEPDRALRVRVLAFSPDGRIVGAGGRAFASDDHGTNGSWWILDVETGEIAHQIYFGDGQPDEIRRITFARDGRTFATGHASGAVRIWDMASHEELLKLPSSDGENRIDPKLEFSPDGTRLAVARSSPRRSPRQSDVEIWNLETGEDPLILSTGAAEEVVSLAFAPDGTELIAGYSYSEREETEKGTPFAARGGKVLIWNLQTGEDPRELRENGRCIAISRNGVLAMATNDGIVLWDFPTARRLRTLNTPHQYFLKQVQDLAISAAGDRVAAATYHGGPTVFIWDAATGQLLPREFESHFSRVSTAGFFAADTKIATLDGRSILRTWATETGQPVLALPFQLSVDRGGAVADTGIVVKAPSNSLEEDWRVEFWDANTGEPVGQHSVPGHVACTTITPDGKLAAAGYADSVGGYGFLGNARKGIRVWNTATNEQVAEVAFPKKYAVAMGFTPDRQSLLYVTPDGSLTAWNFSTGEHTEVMNEMHGVRDGASVGMAFSMDMRTFVASASEIVDVYDIVEKRERLTIAIPQTGANRLAISPDNHTLATAGVQVFSATREFDEAIYLWDLQTGEKIKKVGVPDAAVTAMAFSSDGKQLVTTTEMGTALVWDMR